jgi:hypothetical protein
MKKYTLNNITVPAGISNFPAGGLTVSENGNNKVFL